MIVFGIGQIFFVIGLPIIGFWAVVTVIFLSHQYLTIVNGTAQGAKRVPWTGDTFVDMIGKVPYVIWLLSCTVGPSMIMAGLLAKHVGIVSAALPLIVGWLLLPVVQLSSLYASSMWMPFTPTALLKMAGRPGTTFAFYVWSLVPLVAWVVGVYLCFLPNPMKLPGLFIGAFLIAGAMFGYARMLGRLAFICSFVGAKEKAADEPIPQFSANREVDKPKTKKKPRRFKQPSERQPVKTNDPEDGIGSNVKFDEPRPAEPEVEKEWQPPRFAYDSDDDDDASPYVARAPEVEIRNVVTAETFKPKESDLKLLRAEDEIGEPNKAWSSDLLTEFVGDKETWSQIGLAMVYFTIGGLIVMVMRSFL